MSSACSQAPCMRREQTLTRARSSQQHEAHKSTPQCTQEAELPAAVSRRTHNPLRGCTPRRLPPRTRRRQAPGCAACPLVRARAGSAS